MAIFENYLGIDPGKTGGIAIVSGEGVTITWDMPKTEGDLAELFACRISACRVSLCLIERVHAFPGAGVTSMFTFGRGAGVLIGLLLAHKIPHEEIRPRTWQKALGISPRYKRPKKPKMDLKYYPPEESITEFKRRLMGTAQALFPEVDVTLKTADALLLAEVARRIRVGYQGRRDEQRDQELSPHIC
jgi:crossover junction endodeoxyribonuclease RuvC